MKNIKLKKNNFFKKIFIKICRKLGYEIVDQSNFYLPVSNTFGNELLSKLNFTSTTFPMGTLKITRPVKSLDILIRTCSTVKLLSQNKERLFKKSKSEYSIRTIYSILKAVNYAKIKLKNIKINVTLIDSDSDQDSINKFKKIFDDQDVRFELVTRDLSKYSNLIQKYDEEGNKVRNNDKSNMSNLHHAFETSKGKEDLIYFVEDDYIHTEDSLFEMILTYEKITTCLNKEIFLCPCDYPYLYFKPDGTFLVLGEKYHWRKIDQTLNTVLTSKFMIKKYFSELSSMCKFYHKPFEKPLHKIYENEFCFSPVPSLAMHCTNVNSIFGLSPNIDLIKLWQKNKFNFKRL